LRAGPIARRGKMRQRIDVSAAAAVPRSGTPPRIALLGSVVERYLSLAEDDLGAIEGAC
jgi:hypothetical protein